MQPDVLATEHEEWREGRRNGLANPNAGVIGWDGLFELREGANTFGSDPSLDIDGAEHRHAPCAFTPHSVCSLPPRENYLRFAVVAGEKRP